jgi:foldase protein PrsA
MRMRLRLTLTVSVACLAILLTGCASQPTYAPTAGPSAAPGPSPQETGLPVVQTTAPVRTPGADVAAQYVQRFPGQTLALVNGQAITWEDYEPVLRERLKTLEKNNAVNWEDAAMQIKLRQLQNDVLEQVISNEVMRQMAARQKITIAEVDLEAAVQQERSSILSSGRYTDWDTFLKDYWLTDQGFRRMIEDALLTGKLASTQQVETQADQVHIRHIVVSDKAKAEEVVDKLKAGESFESLAAQYSEDTQTKDKGGDLGWFTEESLISGLKEPVAALEPGETSGVLEIRGSFFVIQVLERGMHELDAILIRRQQQAALQKQIEAETAGAQIERLADFAATTPAP